MFKLIEKKDENTNKGGQVKSKKLTMVSLEHKNLVWNNWPFQKEKLKNVMDINKKLTEQLKSQELKNSVSKNGTSQVLVIDPTVTPTTENQSNKSSLSSG